MFEWFSGLFNRKSLADFNGSLSRERLVQAGRIVFIDDESPLLIEELRESGFAVQHDKTGDDLHTIESQIYDVAIIDYHGVGLRLGPSQGLDLMKHIRRVSPRTRLVAYTSRSLSATESEFFRLSHVVLPKDFGLGDSLALIEGELRKAFDKEHLFEALLTKLDIKDTDQRQRIEEALTKALSRKSEGQFKQFLAHTVGTIAEKTVDILISKIFF